LPFGGWAAGGRRAALADDGAAGVMRRPAPGHRSWSPARCMVISCTLSHVF
jgi:hypothetical protein